jgi:hypothetical protein
MTPINAEHHNGAADNEQPKRKADDQGQTSDLHVRHLLSDERYADCAHHVVIGAYVGFQSMPDMNAAHDKGVRVILTLPVSDVIYAAFREQKNVRYVIRDIADAVILAPYDMNTGILGVIARRIGVAFGVRVHIHHPHPHMSVE